jgi:hypothetical protein
MNERPEISDELSALRARVIRARSEVEILVDGIDDEQFSCRPGTNRWSMHECIDHLIVSGEKIGDRIDGAIEKAHRDGAYATGPFRYSRLGNWFVNLSTGGDQPPTRKLKHPGMYRPSASGAVINGVRAFQALQDNFVERVEACNRLNLARIKIVSPASRLLRLSLGQWLALIAGHQERHLGQARRTRTELGF